MLSNLEYNQSYFAIGIPQKALELTVYSTQELCEFLQFQTIKATQDVEVDQQFLMFYKNIHKIAETTQILANSRDQLAKIFAPEPILSSPDLGYWRALLNTPLPLNPLKVDFSTHRHGEHYAVENRGARSVIRAKGKTFLETQDLYASALRHQSLEGEM